MMEFAEKIVKLKELIQKSERIVAFTGAGISVPSGIPDFRSANGIYAEKLHRTYSPEEMVSHSFLYAHSEEFFSFYREKMLYPEAKPNAAHLLFAKLEEAGKKVSVVTQNIDGLHTAAGNKEVWELHGSVHRNYCTRCFKSYDMETIYSGKGVPHCTCGGLIRPDVVLYEESLDGNVIDGAIRAIRTADLLIVVGTSLVVYPAASFLHYFRGEHLVLVNLSRTPMDSMAELCIYEDCEKVAKALTG